jgi:hypothetical protein
MTNPLLSKVKLPGRIFQLPSLGLFYKNGELADNVVNGEIHVRPMSALAEIHMKNPDQLFSGQAVETVFKECVEGVQKPSQLLAKDVDAIMMFLRTVTYGPNYEFAAKHHCEGAKEHTYIADVDSFINTMVMMDPTTLDKLYKVTLPNEQVVHLQPSRYGHVVALLKANQGKEEITVEDAQANLMMMLNSVVTRVDDVTDAAQIDEWLRAVPTTYVTAIANKIDAINKWGPSMRWKGKCRDCGGDLEVELPINPVSFFTE